MVSDVDVSVAGGCVMMGTSVVVVSDGTTPADGGPAAAVSKDPTIHNDYMNTSV